MKRTPLIALAIAAATALPVAQSHAAKPRSTAYFDVLVTAGQDITWKEDITDHSCQGVYRIQGDGTSLTNLGTGSWQPMVARRVGGQVSFSFAGGHGDVAVGGELERQGNQVATTIVPSPSHVCGQLIPTPRDCGVRKYPAGTRLQLRWDSPRAWSPGTGPKPLRPSLHLSGPYVPNYSQSVGYLNCAGERDDYMLGMNAYPDPGTFSGFGALPLRTLFGTKRRFAVSGGLKGIVRHTVPPTATGDSHSDVSLHWTVRFKRLARRPKGL